MSRLRLDSLVRPRRGDTKLRKEWSFFELRENGTLWGMLLNAGYITQVNKMDPLSGFCEVRIPNYEVKREFQSIVAQYTKIQSL